MTTTETMIEATQQIIEAHIRGGGPIVLCPRAYPMCHMFICTYILPHMSYVLLMCTTGSPCHLCQTFLLSKYLAALDLLTCHGLPAYLGHTSHTRAAPSTHTYLHCF